MPFHIQMGWMVWDWMEREREGGIERGREGGIGMGWRERVREGRMDVYGTDGMVWDGCMERGMDWDGMYGEREGGGGGEQRKDGWVWDEMVWDGWRDGWMDRERD